MRSSGKVQDKSHTLNEPRPRVGARLPDKAIKAYHRAKVESYTEVAGSPPDHLPVNPLALSKVASAHGLSLRKNCRTLSCGQSPCMHACMYMFIERISRYVCIQAYTCTYTNVLTHYRLPTKNGRFCRARLVRWGAAGLG